MTKGELIRLMEGTDDDIIVVIENSDGAKIPITKVHYVINQGYGFYAIKGDF